MSVGGLPGFDDLAVDPQSYLASSFLVRFQSDAGDPAALAAVGGTTVGKRLPLVLGLHKVQLTDPGLTLAAALAAYRANANVLYAEPDYRIRLEAIPDDPQFGSLWGLHNTGQSGGTVDADIDAPEAWNVTTGSAATVVAVIDTGVDYTHPDLAGNIWTNSGEIPGDGLDNDANGYIDDVHGYDFVNRDPNPMDDHSHGTHVAGAIGAAGDNGVGVAGINWQVQIMALKFLDASGSGSTSDAIEALDYAVANGAVISNNSWGGDPYSQALFDAIGNARDQGHIFVAAAGNNGANNDQSAFYPAGYELDNVVSVAATDRNDRLASFSNYGAQTVDLAAPGVDILSTVPGGGYATNSGTSMAAPHVTGVVALVRGQHPEWTHQQVIQQVLASVDYVPALDGRTATAGRLNAARAVGAPDVEGPRVLRSDPSGGVGGVVGSIRLFFHESIDPATFDAGDIVSFTGPEGPIAAAGVAVVAGSRDRQFDVTFAPQAVYGVYTMEIGPDIRDAAGNAMDQDQDGVQGEVPGDRFIASFTLGATFAFASADVPKSLGMFATAASTLYVDQNLSIADVDVWIDVAYPDVGLLDVALVSPSGTTVSLAPNTIFLGPDYQGTVFDDEAAVPISSGSPPFAGSYRPASPLSALDGQFALGTWQLRVRNLWFDRGSIDGWGLSILASPPRLSIDDVEMSEGDSESADAVFTVSLSNPIGEPVTVDYATADGTAAAGGDYAAAGGTLTFLPGEVSKAVRVTVFGDLVDEPDETFFAQLANAGGAVVADGQGRCTIRNDETSLAVDDVTLLEGNSGTASAVFTVSLSTASAQPVSVSYATADGDAASASDYTAASGTLVFAPGETSKTIAVSVNGDAANEAGEAFFLDLTGSENALIADGRGQATVLNDDPIPSLSVGDVIVTEGNAGTKNVTFTVSLSAVSGRTVSVPYATADSSAAAGEDYLAAGGTVTFAPGQTSRSVAVALNGDGETEPDETFFLVLGAPSGAILLDAQGIATLLNDDASIWVDDWVLTEGNAGTAAANVVVSLSQAVSFPVTAAYATANASAAAGSDYAIARGTLTFAPGQTSQSIAVEVIGDARNEADEVFYVNLSQPSGALLAHAQAAVTIRDDDPLPGISVADVEIAEGPSGTKNVAFTLALSTPSGRPVTVYYSTADGTAEAGSDYAAKSGWATIYAGAITATVSVAVNGDADFEADESFFLNLSDPGNATLADDQAVATILEDDSLRIADVGLAEGDDGVRVAEFAVSLAAPLARDVSFGYATANGSATAGVDYAASSGRAVIPAGQTEVAIPVWVLPDARNEAEESFFLNLSGAEGAILANSRGTATIADDDPLPSVSIADVSVAEGNSGTKNVTFTLALSAPSGRTASVRYATADGTAVAGSDYTAKSGVLNFYAGSVVQYVNVAVSGDAAIEPGETFFLDLSDPSNLAISDAQGAATIVSDDPAPCLSIRDVKTTEGNAATKTFSFTVNLSAAGSQTVTVEYETADGAAAAGSDYLAQAGTLTFTPGQTARSVVVTVKGDAASEADEDFLVRLSNPAGAVLLDGEGLGTIVNDDTSVVVSDAAAAAEGDGGPATATFLVSLPGPAGHEVRVDYATANSSATAGSDYAPASGTLVFAPGQTSKAVAVAVLGDRADEADEVFLLKLANPIGAQIADSQGSATIQDDDPLPSVSVADVSIAEGASGTKSLTFALAISAPSGRAVTVNYATANGTATAGSDYAARSGAVTFAAGSTSQSVSITVNGDALAEFNETILLNLTGATNATIAGNQATGTILDDDNLSIADAAAAEGDDGTTTIDFTVSLALPLSYEVRVDYATANGTATAGSDYVATGGTVVFAPGETSKAITVLVLADRVDEPDQSFLVTLSDPVNTVLGVSQATATILDDDATPTVSINSVRLTEGNSGTKNATFTVSLSAASGQSITVTYATADGTAVQGVDYLPASGTLTFNPGHVTRTFSVVVNGDAEWESDETLLVRLSNPAGATLAASEGWAAILDDDADLDLPEGLLASLADRWEAASRRGATLDAEGEARPPRPPAEFEESPPEPAPVSPQIVWDAVGAGTLDLDAPAFGPRRPLFAPGLPGRPPHSAGRPWGRSSSGGTNWLVVTPIET